MSRIQLILELADGAGEVRLAANDPHVQPSLNYRCLEEERDLERLREAVRITLKLLEHESFAAIVDQVIQPLEQDLVSDSAPSPPCLFPGRSATACGPCF